MHIVAMAWIYVVLLMAVTEPNLTAAILTFVLYGLLPLVLFAASFGRLFRRRRPSAGRMTDDNLGHPNGRDAQGDQGDLL